MTLRNQAPRVTVVLPARNAALTIDRAVASILSQTFLNFELLAIDDGSVDDTGLRLKQWAAHDARVRILTTSGCGLVSCLNWGLAEARGEYLARMDADDESLPTRFEKSVAALDAHPHWAGIGTGVDIFREDRPPSPNLQRYGQWLSSLTSPAMVFRDRYIESPLCHPSTMLRRAPLQHWGGWKDGPFPEDWELWLRLMEQGEQLSCLPEVLHRWRDGDHRLTRLDARYAWARHLDLKADSLARTAGTRPIIIWGATKTGRAMALRLKARGRFLRGFVEVNEKKLGQRLHGIPVFEPESLKRDGSLVISCVAAQGARHLIREFLHQRGFQEMLDFICAA